jgi:hypothetical protein
MWICGGNVTGISDERSVMRDDVAYWVLAEMHVGASWLEAWLCGA